MSHNSAVSKHMATILSACIHSVLAPGMPVRIIASYFSDLQHIWSVLFGNGMSGACSLEEYLNGIKNAFVK